jgi:hypothetical protein
LGDSAAVKERERERERGRERGEREERGRIRQIDLRQDRGEQCHSSRRRKVVSKTRKDGKFIHSDRKVHPKVQPENNTAYLLTVRF